MVPISFEADKASEMRTIKKRYLHRFQQISISIGAKMRVENHSDICHIMLFHFEKGWKAAESFRDLNDFLAKEQSAKVSVGSGLHVSNQVISAWRIS
ncbi:hypothetical protein TNIN_416831 [Trichonephila inaurata madagascariensis]|uniref:Mos1 transposase HTH domain-containing protein n=1 Tax=Trichonephila inaurata madagascariensis TaxID=2747483 RepID=A0A8X6IA21_9ARAC|nr:hypothetical protein TNIN_416831 [Trichonephila inaurata madagascariensis]